MRRFTLLILVAAIAAVASASASSANKVLPSIWSMSVSNFFASEAFGNNVARGILVISANERIYGTSTKSYMQVWAQNTTWDSPGQPLVSDELNGVFMADRGRIIKYSLENGTKLWENKPLRWNKIGSSSLAPLVHNSGLLWETFTHSAYSEVYAVDAASGTTAYSHLTLYPNPSAPVISGGNGTHGKFVFVAFDGAFLIFQNTNAHDAGIRVDSFDIECGAVAIGARGTAASDGTTFFFPTYDGQQYGVQGVTRDPENGQWRCTNRVAFTGEVIATASGMLLVVGSERVCGYRHAGLNLTNAWCTDVPGGAPSVSVESKGVLYVVVNKSIVAFAVNNGTVMWTYNHPTYPAQLVIPASTPNLLYVASRSQLCALAIGPY